MKGRAYLAAGALAATVLAVLEVAWLAARMRSGPTDVNGDVYLLRVVLPRAVLAGLTLSAIQCALMSFAEVVAGRAVRWRGTRQQWHALMFACGATICSAFLASALEHGRRALTSSPLFMVLFLVGMSWLAYEAALVGKGGLRWIEAPFTDARIAARRRRAAASLLVILTCALWMVDRIVLVRLYEPLHVALRLATFATLQGSLLLGSAALRIDRAFVIGASRAMAVPLVLAVAAMTMFEIRERGSERHAAALNALRLHGAFGRTLLGLTDARRAGRAPTPTPQSGQPMRPPPDFEPAVTPGANILLITVDALRADHLGVYGYRRAISPRIDALAAASVVFDRAYTSAPHTSFALTSMLTGCPAMTLSELGLLEGRPTLAELATANGYRTAAFFTPAVFFVDGERFARFDERSFGFETVERQLFPETSSATQQTDHVLAYLSKADPRRFVIWTHYFGPHEPYVEHPEAGEDLGHAAVDRYDGEIRWTDREIGRLVESVRTLYPQTIVVLTADHGEEFGEHGGAYHGTTLFDEQTRVPLMLSVPGLEPGRVHAPVSTTSILPTLLSLTGVPPLQTFDGPDLRPWMMPTRHRAEIGLPPAFAENAGQRSVMWGDDKLLCDNRTDTCALFDLSLDATEHTDVAVARPARVTALRRQLATWVEKLERQRGLQDLWETLDSRSTPVSIRRLIARRMARLPEARWTVRLREAWRREADPLAKAWLAAAASQTGDERARSALRELVGTTMESDPDLASLAALARFAEAPAQAAAEVASALERVSDVNLRCALMKALARGRSPGAVAVLEREYEFIRSRICAAEGLASLGDPSALPFILAKLVDEPYSTVQGTLVRALGNLHDTRAIPVLRLVQERTKELDLLQLIGSALAQLESSDRGR